MKAEQSKLSDVVVLHVIFMVIVFLVPSVMNAEVLFIVNESVTVDTLSKTDIKKIFLGDSPVWPNGEEIVLVTQRKTDIQAEFAKEYTQKTESQFTNYWRRLMFSGKGAIPKFFSSDREIVDFVANTKGAIGYISSDTKTNNVKSITVSDN